MYLKNKNKTPEVGFTFFFESPTGDTVRVPLRGSASGLEKLRLQVEANFKNLGMDIPKNLAQIIEHQICLRHRKPLDACWEGGLGDHIHHSLAKPFLSSLAQSTEKVLGSNNIVARTARKVSGCSACGGTKTYKQGKNNLGRAAYVNQIGKKH